VRRHRTYPVSTTCEAIGPSGEALSVETRTPQEAGPMTLWHVASAIPAAGRAIIGLATHDFEGAGGEVGAVLVDALVVYGLSGEAARKLLARFDALLYPQGGCAFKEEVESLSKPTIGLVVGVGKVLMGRVEDGEFRLVRSSDTAGGNHLVDPTGTGDLLDDGRTAWMAALEARRLAHAVETGRVAVPPDLPAWADRPAMYPRRATTIAELRRLRERAGDQTLMPGAAFVTVGADDGSGPVCIGAGRDPGDWRSWPWRATGGPCRVGVIDAEGEIVESLGAGTVFIVPMIRDWFDSWLRERDDTLEGPAGEPRRPVLARSHAACVQLVGKESEDFGAAAEDRDEPLVFESGVKIANLLDEAATVGTAGLVAAGVPERTAKRVSARKARPTRRTVRAVAAAVASAPERPCEGPGCSEPVTSRRRDAHFCSLACRVAAHRAGKDIPRGAEPAPTPVGRAAPPPEPAEDDRVAAALALLQPLVGGANLAGSPKVPGLVAACLAAGVDAKELFRRIESDGPLKGRSPVGILAKRLEALAVELPREFMERRWARKKQVVRHAHRLGALVVEGIIPADCALGEIDAAYAGSERGLALRALRNDLEVVRP
jgi:hypothetical protein